MNSKVTREIQGNFKTNFLDMFTIAVKFFTNTEDWRQSQY